MDISGEQWTKIKPVMRAGKESLTKDWKAFFLDHWNKQCNCVLALGYSHVSNFHSRKSNLPYVYQCARCTFDNCCKFKASVRRNQNF